MSRFGQGQAVHNYIQAVIASVTQKDGDSLAAHLKKSPQSPTAFMGPELVRIRNLDNFCSQPISRQLDQEWASLVSNHCHAYLRTQDGNYVDAFTAQSKCADSFHRIFRKETTNWLVPVLFVIIADVKTFAMQADNVLKQAGKQVTHLNTAVIDIFTPLLRTCLSDRTTNISNSKITAALRIVNHCFASYFELNTVTLCKNLIQTIEGTGTPPITEYPISHQVTYNYYNGKLALFAGEYRRARSVLQEGFYKCSNNSIKNKRLLLLYLVPVQVLLGTMPSNTLLKKYSIVQLIDIVNAVRTGNVKLFNEALVKHEGFFIGRGLYLIMEKLRVLTYRNLLKRIVAAVPESSKSKLLLETVVLPIFHWMGETDTDIDEVECIIANLIWCGYIKGYISHKLRCLVLSTKNPFPAVSSVAPNKL